MTYHSTDIIENYFYEKQLSFTVREADHGSSVDLSLPLPDGREALCRFISPGKRNDVAVRVFSLIGRVPKKALPGMLRLLNSLNEKYRFFKFVLDESRSVDLEYDLPPALPDAVLGLCCHECLLRLTELLAAEYPLLKAASESPAKRIRAE